MSQSCSSPRFVACAALLKFYATINRVTAALVLSACVATAAAQSESEAFAKFKREMMPKVGQKVTVVGPLYDGKQGFWVAFNGWGADIYATTESGIAKQNNLYAHFRSGQTVKITGILRHYAPPPATRNDVQSLPEHFYFDVAEVNMSLWPARTPKESDTKH